MPCSHLATYLDIAMLRTNGVSIADASVAESALPLKPGPEVALELSGRFLLRYLRKAEVDFYSFGSLNRHFCTPTAYSAEECAAWLCLPDPTVRRTHVLLLDATKVSEIRGPRWVEGGRGIEYILPAGFPQAALVTRWAMQVW
jgi:hypothetical protein